MKKAIIAFSALAAMTLFSCSKKDDTQTTNPTPTNTNPLIGTWKETAQVSDTSLKLWDTTTEIWSHFPDCYRDNLWIFKDGGVLVYDNNTQKCSASEPQTITGTWSKTDNYLDMAFPSNPSSPRALILQLDNTTLKYRQMQYTYSGNDTVYYIATITMTKQ